MSLARRIFAVRLTANQSVVFALGCALLVVHVAVTPFKGTTSNWPSMALWLTTGFTGILYLRLVTRRQPKTVQKWALRPLQAIALLFTAFCIFFLAIIGYALVS